MPPIEAIAERVEPVGRDVSNAALLARFVAEPNAMAIPVVEDDRLIGLVDRDAFLLKMACPDNHLSVSSMTAGQVMDVEPAVVDARIEIDAACDVFLSGGASGLTRAFGVTLDGSYLGVCTGLALLQAGQVASTANGRAETMLMSLERELAVSASGVLAVTELMTRQRMAPEALNHVQTIADNAETMLATLREATDMVRSDSGELTIAPAPTHLRTLMDEVQTAWAGRTARQGVTLLLGYEGDTDLRAEIDAGRMRQLFDTLISTALSVTRDGVIEAGLKAWVDGDDVRLEGRVRDNGPSIPQTQLSAAFGLDTDRGRGLGLNLAERLVRLMGGRIWAENNSGRGATYAFDLIALRVANAPTASNVSAIIELDMQSQPHILIVDDNATNRVVAQALCEMFGCTCETAEDGLEALEAVQARRFDMVLMDIKMPRMDGVEATRAIRALDGPVSQVPIVALTANADPEDARRYIATGMAAVVEKPIKPERLRMAMNAALSADEATENSPTRASA